MNLTELEFSARLGLLEKLTSDLLLNSLYRAEVPEAAFSHVRDKTISALRRSAMPPGSTAQDADVGLYIQSQMIGFAERYFEGLRKDLEHVLSTGGS